MELTLGSMAWGRVAQILALLIAVLCAAPVMAGDSIMTGTRVAGDETRTRFVADLTLPVGYTVYVLPDPYRVIIDMPQIRFDLPDGGSIVLDGPLHALRQWIDAMAATTPTWRVVPGEFVTTGTITDAWPMRPGQHWQTRLSDARLAALSLHTIA